MQIFLLITDKCNLRCSMCIRGENKGIDMDYNVLAKTSLAENFSDAEIIITGGEPTMHSAFCDFVEYVCRFAKTAAVTTNGTLDYYIDGLSNKDNLIYQVSLDGNEETNDAIRGVGSYSRTASTLNKLDKSGVKYCVASVVSRKNRDSIAKLIPFLSSLKRMRYWRISYEMPFGNSGLDNMMKTEEWNDFVDDVINKANFRLKIQKIFPFKLYDENLSDMESSELIAKRCFNCGSGRDKIYIYPDFNIYSCTCLTDFCLGNLRENSLDNILLGEEIKKFSEYKINSSVPCNKCQYYKFCKGGCIGMSYHYFGSLGKGDIRCPILKGYYD